MKQLHTIILMIFLLPLTYSCVEEEEYPNTIEGNFQALWNIMDEHYCFFQEKEQELGVNWNEVYTRYQKQAVSPLSRDQLFELLSSMLGELRDGHVNLSSTFDYGRNWSWKENYPTNFSDTLIRKYLGTDYRMANGLKYRILDDNAGYIQCPSFDLSFGNGNIDEVLYYLAPCSRLIIDVRNNGGGLITSAQKLASRFTDTEIIVGYIRHKTGKGHQDFSDMEEQRLSPGKGIRWRKPVYILTNRSVYSAANEFVKCMKEIGKRTHRVTIIGDVTGGGAGLPFTSELPNGWGVRFSACPVYDAEGMTTEFGITPDIKVNITDDDFDKGIDTIIETARK